MTPGRENAAHRLAHYLAAALAEERERWVLWLPVCLAAGIGVYFLLPAEPPLWLGPGVLAIAVVAAWAVRRRAALVIPVLVLAVAAAGFAIVQWRAAVVAAPMLTARTGPATVSGRLASVQSLPKGLRVIVERPRISRLAPERTPERVRIRLSGRQPELTPGDWITVRAILGPPPPPAAPGAFDFQRQSYFRQLGGVGFSIGPAAVTAAAASEGLAAFALALARARQRIGGRIRAALPGPAGGLAAALMTGQRGAIPPTVMQAMRDSGLAHLLAISGLHIGLVAGILFMGLRSVLALAGSLALHYPIKKWAAAAAIIGAAAYALIAGATVPTQRAFLMIGLVLVAVLLDRRGLSMRMVAWAAVVVLTMRPESLLGPSFQMSFAAVTALIAAYEVVRARRLKGGRFAWPRTWHGRALLYLGGVMLTTLIAGSATAPFAIYHFNRFADFALIANLAAVPLTALWIMPWAVAAFLLMPLGLEAWALAPMGWGVEGVMMVAETVAGWPGAVTLLPAMPVWGLAVIALGGCWLCLWRRRWRWWGAPALAIGLASLLLAPAPDILIDGRGRLMAVRLQSGGLMFSSPKAAAFNRRLWLRRAGQEQAAGFWPAAFSSADGGLICDRLGCIFRAGGKVISLVRREEALAEDCWMADVVVSVVPVRGPCPSAATVIDRFDLWRHGGHALWIGPGGRVRVSSVNQSRGDRPWVIRPDD